MDGFSCDFFLLLIYILASPRSLIGKTQEGKGDLTATLSGAMHTAHAVDLRRQAGPQLLNQENGPSMPTLALPERPLQKAIEFMVSSFFFFALSQFGI